MASSVAGPPERRRSWKRFVRRWVIVLGGGYLLVCCLMWLLENRLVFFPVKASEAWTTPPASAQIEDVNFAAPGGTQIHGWWKLNPASDNVLVVFPGNAGNISGRGETVVLAAERLNTSVLIFDYPGYGKSAGKPNEQNCYDAAEGALRWLRDVKVIAPERIALYGESLGGGVASEMATRHKCRALILVKTFTSLPAVAKQHYPWLPTHWLMSNRFETLAKLPRINCPVFVAGASADRVVPFEHSEALFAAVARPKHFFRDEGADHNDPLPDQFWLELRQFLDSN